MKPAASLLAALWVAAAVGPGVAHGSPTGSAAATTKAPAVVIPGVTNEALAHQYYMLQCQGCHRPDGTGTSASAPPMAGMAARFLAVPGGREYLGRVPGVATAVLSDAQLAELLNWTLYRFDPTNVPADFKPYTAAEIGALRRRPLRIEAAAVRASLVTELDQRTPAR